LLTVQRAEDAAAAVDAAALHAASGDCVTVVGVPPKMQLCAHWVGLTGVAHCPGLRDELIDEVAALVRTTVASLPACVGVEHRVAHGWRDPRLLARIEAGCFDAVVLVAAPRRRRDRRALERAAWAGGARVVFPQAATTAVGEDLPLATPAYA